MSCFKFSIGLGFAVLISAGANAQVFAVSQVGHFLSVNTTTGQTTQVGTLPTGTYLGLAYDGSFFYTTRNAILTRIDPVTFVATGIGTALASRVESLAFGGDGNLYAALDINGGFTAETVARIDKNTGSNLASAVPANGFADLNGMATDSAGNLHLFNLDSPRSIAKYDFSSNTISNSASLSGAAGFVVGATIDDVVGSDSFLASTIPNINAGGQSSLVRISKTGVVTSVGFMNHFNVTGLANIAPPVPEPATFAVLGVGLMALRLRKKSA